jgi:glycine/D-amino acid oxidase-like deaminating enzyme
MGTGAIDPKNQFVTEPERKIPIAGQTQVLVIGGGIAGTAAALAARRCGARTQLIERDGYPGGTGTAGLMSLITLPYERVYGICRELVDAMADRGAAARGPVIPFDPEAFKRVAVEKFLEAGVHMRFYTWSVDTIVADGRVRGVIVENKSGRQAILADVVIDASGDGDLAKWSGAQVVQGREEDGMMRPMNLIFRFGPVDVRQIAAYREANPAEFSPDPGHNFLDLDQGIVRLDGFFDIMRWGRDQGLLDPETHYLRLYGLAGETGNLYVNTSRVYGVDGTDADDLTRAHLESMHQIDQLASFLRAHVPGFEKAQVLETAARIGVRETRRIVGDYTLTIEDCANAMRFPDAIATAETHMVPGVHVHSPDGGEGQEKDPFVTGLVLPFNEFSIPLRCLLPRTLDGILVAGRAISTTHEADGWTRIQPVMMQIGEGAGTVAARAVAEGVDPRRVNMAKVRETLLANGAHVLMPG